jgi:2-polyprenyl-3-methyl-5-hydroxy-6-metoxy-1,4-benzoquinol methylase
VANISLLIAKHKVGKVISMEYKTWDDFWGEFLQIRFHSGNPELWPFRQKKALWFLRHCRLTPGARILDLGCGDGLIDIWLSRMGFDVTAVDRNKSVLDIARSFDDTKHVKFLVSDLREISFPSESFDAILLIETLGLMSKVDDSSLLSKSHNWLKPKGQIILDSPETVEDSNSWSKEFPEGIVRGESSFDHKSKLQNIQFFFRPNGGEEFGLHDPYDTSKTAGSGVIRYIFPKSELENILRTANFDVRELDHYYPVNYFALAGTKT